MSDFELAVAKTIANEGGDKYTEIPGDKGGATKYGISFKFLELCFKNLPKDKPDFSQPMFFRKPDFDMIKNLTIQEAKFLYKKYFWYANRYGEIEDQAIADKVFDMAVLMGAPRSNRIVQMYFNYSYNEYNQLKEDGIFGEKTLDEINNINIGDAIKWHAFMNGIKFGCIKSFVSICNEDKTQSKFLLGWLNRVMS